MIKSDLIDTLAKKAEITTVKAEDIVNLFVDEMTEAMLRGERIEIRGFGSLAVKEYDGYTGRNPRTGVSIQVRAKRLPVFKANKELKRRINS